MDVLIIPPIDPDLYCPSCGSSNIIKRGFYRRRVFSGNEQQLYGCKDCERRFFFGSGYGNPTMLPIPGKCPNCNSREIRQKGYKTGKYGTKPRYKCKSCGYQFVEKPFGFVDSKEYNKHLKLHPRNHRAESMDAKR